MKTKLLFYILFFICLGITTEVFFTAISDAFAQFSNEEPVNMRLMGHTYIWMAFIYGWIPVLFAIGYPKISNLPLFIRLLVYILFIYIIEFVSGFLLEQLTGRCPWKYDTGWHIMGYIRLDYALFWMFFGFILERVYVFLEEHFQFT